MLIRVLDDRTPGRRESQVERELREVPVGGQWKGEQRSQGQENVSALVMAA